MNNQWGSESGEYGFNVIVVDYNNDGYRDVIGFIMIIQTLLPIHRIIMVMKENK